MFFIEYNWTACQYQLRFGTRFTDWRGTRGWDSLAEAREFFKAEGYKLAKTDSRTWAVESLPRKVKARDMLSQGCWPLDMGL